MAKAWSGARIFLLALCVAASPGAAAAQNGLVVEGAARLAGRSVAPAGSTLVVELAQADGGRTLAERRLRLARARTSIPFRLTVPRPRLSGVRGLRLRAALIVGAAPRFLSDPVEVPSEAARVRVGALSLRPYRPLAFASGLVCGGRKGRLGIEDDAPALDFDGRIYPLRRAGASPGEDGRRGERYVGAAGELVLWLRGETGTLRLPDGRVLECRKA